MLLLKRKSVSLTHFFFPISRPHVSLFSSVESPWATVPNSHRSLLDILPGPVKVVATCLISNVYFVE